MPDPKIVVVDGDRAQCNRISRMAELMQLSCDAYATAEEMLDANAYRSGGVLVCEFRLLGINGVDLQQKLHELDSSMQIVFHTGYAETWLTVLAMKQGAFAVLDKPTGEQELWDTIRLAMHKYDESVEFETARTKVRRNIQQLSHRQYEVLRLIIEGMPNKQIAARLGVSIRTVESCRHTIFEKTCTRSIADLVRRIVQSKVVLEDRER